MGLKSLDLQQLALGSAATLALLGLHPHAAALDTVYHQQLVSGASGTATLPLFDAALGSLQKVTINGTLTSDTTVTQFVNCPFNALGTACSPVLGGAISAEATFSRGLLDFALTASDSFQTNCVTAAGQSRTCNQFIGIFKQATASATDAPTLALFSGSGSFGINFVQRFSTPNSTTGGLRQSGGFNVTYEYLASPVPEPGTWALMLAGLAGCTGWARRQQLQQRMEGL